MIFLLLSVVQAEWWSKSKTLDITTSNYPEFMGHDKDIAVVFYTPSCQSCKLMFSEWESVWEHFNDPSSPTYDEEITIARINSLAEPSLGDRYHIAFYPTILFIPAGKTDPSSVYPGNKVKDDIVRWIHSSREALYDDYTVYEIFIDDASSEVSDNIRDEFTRLHKKTEEFRKYFEDELMKVAMNYQNLKHLARESFVDNAKKYLSVKDKIEELEFNIVNRNKAESAHTRFNYTHMIVFSTLGIIVGLSIGIVVQKSKKTIEYSKV